MLGNYMGEDRQMDAPCALCEVCRGDLYPCDSVYYVDGCVVCPECIEEFAIEYFGCRLLRLEEIMGGCYDH